VAAQDYREDLRISQEILNHLIEAYRKIRNTCRFLLSNLYDFDAAQHRVPYRLLPELDRWALTRLGGLVNRTRLDYKEFEFHAIFHELNNFCSVDMSAVYLDILKDRLYTFRKEDHFRRSSQTVMLEILVAMTKLMAPILSFTAEEIWRMLPESARGDQQVFSVHLAAFPEFDPQWIDEQLAQNWNDFLLHIRSKVLGKLEEKRRDRIIGSSLEAKVILYAQLANPAQYDFLKPYEDFLPTLFIVSQVELHGVDQLPMKADNLHDLADGIEVEVVKADGAKCERCWNYRPAVGTFKDHPTLCDRCIEAVQ
jgi:isoleucyl-tRNA synthetase